MKNSALYYGVGPLLYCPANKESIADSLIKETFGRHFSLALCLEDTIGDGFVSDAENILAHSLQKLQTALEKHSFFLPKIFVRVRNAGQMKRVLNLSGSAGELIHGFIAPKFSTENVNLYLEELSRLQSGRKQPLYLMPILENPAMADLRFRYEFLYSLKETLDDCEDNILNIRVGGNDLCHVFGLRRSSYESIHKIGPISSIFSDIITVFGQNYVISGPVWEYYSGEHWEEGLKQELKEDRLNGFVGKTVIHPNQIETVWNAYLVNKKDYEDACAILNWDPSSHSLVHGNVEGARMNEYNTHSHWAQKILYLSEAYGVSDS